MAARCNRAAAYNRSRMLETARFVWSTTRGHRLRPWRSPLLRWRLETFTGKHAEDVRARDFWRFLIDERGQILRFSRWLAEMRGYSGHFDR